MLSSILVCIIACLGIAFILVVFVDNAAGRRQRVAGRRAAVACLLLSMALVSCSAMAARSTTPSLAKTSDQSTPTSNNFNQDLGTDKSGDKGAAPDTDARSDSVDDSAPMPVEPQDNSFGSGVPSESAVYTAWSEVESPNYVRLVGDAQIASPVEPGQVIYSEPDALGRTQQVRACITRQMMDEGEARKRGEMPNPAGWPAQNFEADIALPTGRTYHGWFWNRCHLLAKSLGGSEDVRNLVTGTRMLNVGANDGQGGMDMFETAIRSWLGYYPDVTVQYVATPIYEGDELICRSVMVDVLSSDGALNERLEVYNAAKGYRIDYSTGSVMAQE